MTALNILKFEYSIRLLAFIQSLFYVYYTIDYNPLIESSFYYFIPLDP